jgi:hypothetical protein
MPTGPTLVASLGVALILAALIFYIRAAENRGNALVKSAAGLAVVAGVVAGVSVFVTSGTFLHIDHEHDWEDERASRHAHEGLDDAWHQVAHACDHDPACISSRLLARDDWPVVLATTLSEEDPGHRETAAAVAGLIGDRQALDALAAAAPDEPDNLLRLEEARILTDAGDRRGLEVAVAFLSSDAPLLYRDEANTLLMDQTGQDFGYDPFAPVEENADAVDRWRRWLAGHD